MRRCLPSVSGVTMLVMYVVFIINVGLSSAFSVRRAAFSDRLHSWTHRQPVSDSSGSVPIGSRVSLHRFLRHAVEVDDSDSSSGSGSGSAGVESKFLQPVLTGGIENALDDYDAIKTKRWIDKTTYGIRNGHQLSVHDLFETCLRNQCSGLTLMSAVDGGVISTNGLRNCVRRCGRLRRRRRQLQAPEI